MKKILTIVISVALVAAIAVGGTLAYLSSNAGGTKLNNTFTTTTAGSNLNITLDEGKIGSLDGKFTDAGVTRTVLEQKYPIIPGATMDKDPIITILTNSAPCYVFTYVSNTAKLGNAAVADIVDLNVAWTPVDSTNYPGLYVYSTSSGAAVVPSPTSINGTVLPVFTQIKIKSSLTQVDLKNTYSGGINVCAYAHQASGDVDYTNNVLPAAKAWYDTVKVA